MRKKIRLLKIFSLLILTTFLMLPVYSQGIKFSDENQSFIFDAENPEILKFHSSLNNLRVAEINTKAGRFSQILVDDYGFSMEEGKPQLPVLKQLIEIPWGCEVEVVYNEQKIRVIGFSDLKISYPVFPAQPSVSKQTENPDDLDFIFDSLTYSTNRFFAFEPVNVIDLGILRGVRLARLEISPFRYNPVTSEMEILFDLDAEIHFKNADLSFTENEKTRVFSPWFENNFNQLINHTSPQNRSFGSNAPQTYIIVSDPMFQTALQPFIQWKTRKGFNVIEAYTNNPSVGTTTTSIKAYLKNFYLNPPIGYLPQSFVLFVGDVAQIPAFNGTTATHITDLYYCEYTNDKLPEVFYGRFSANSITELQPQIDKTLEYEQYLMPDPSFLDEVVMVTGDDASHELTWGNGQINYGTQNYFNAAHGLTSHTYLQPEPNGGNYSTKIIQNVSSGVAYANYTAHCGVTGWSNPSFSNGNVASLQNAHQYPLMVGNCCQSNSFGSTCFGETLLRAAGKGALGYIGGTNYTYWDEDYWWGVGFKAVTANPTYNVSKLGAYDRTFHDKPGITTNDWFVTQGQMVSAGNLAVSQSGSGLTNYYWEIYQLMGDPSVMIYFSQPPEILATYPPKMPLTAETFAVTTEPYAYVAISKNGVLHGAALADASGAALVSLQPIAEPGTAEIVITRQNRKPYFGTIEIETGEPITQFIYLPAGWSGISTYLIPENSNPEILFQSIIEEIVILQNFEGIFYPGLNINTLGNWDNHEGYKIKLNNAVALEIAGWNDSDKMVNLKPGWNLLPVISECPQPVLDIFGVNIDHILIIKEIAGLGVYWPQMNINTLGVLFPGNAYFILSDSEFTFIYPDCE
jgi:hypothetical protein